MDWRRVFENARQDGLQRIVSCALILARELLEAKLPPAVVARIERDSRARTSARKLCRSLFTEDDTASPLENPYLSIGLRLRQLGFYLGIRERYRERIRHLGELFRVDKLART